jgi:predicted ATPase
LIEQAVLEGKELGHIATMANTIASKALLEAYRDDHVATGRAAEDSLTFAKKHDMPFFSALGELQSSWARGRLVDPEAELTELRLTLTALVEKGYRGVAPVYYGLIGILRPGLVAQTSRCRQSIQVSGSPRKPAGTGRIRFSSTGEA